ncbi:ABC transporter permease [Phormidium tenue FACHB-886]|nr:ABC transporter permease [Phormidium tenue FACHB-886]
MNLLDSIQIAVKALSRNKLRSSLTMLGIIIGNSSVIALVGIGQGVQQYTLEQLDSYGANLVTVFASFETEGATPNEASRLVLSDAEAIQTQAPAVQEVAPQISLQSSIAYRGRRSQVVITGTTPGLLFVRNRIVASGRFFNASELNQNSQSVVLGAIPAQQLFGSTNPIGQEVQINQISFQVIGVLQSKGASAGVSQDDLAYIPITTLFSQLDGQPFPYGIPIDSIEVSAVDKQSIPAATFQITNILNRRHGQQDFSVQSDQAFQSVVSQVAQGLSLMLAAIASISLLVGGIGIMNIMLVSVTERTQEIGLRKAVGATSQAILIQFLIEAVMLSVAGGLVGTAVGIGGTMVVAMLTPLTPAVPWIAITFSVGVSGSIGLIFGVIPAQRAAQLDPIVALRSA